MHNDVVIFEKNWICRLRDFILQTSNAGVVGLYGAKTMRRDGSFKGKTIVHSKKGGASITGPFERVAVVDGLLLAVGKTVFEKIGGFSEDFSIHYYDKDISMRSLKKGFLNYIINIQFEHRCGITRIDIKDENTVRHEAQKKFIEIWSGSLPADASTWREKLTYLLKM
jgi:GT2 family glycosyltransferase